MGNMEKGYMTPKGMSTLKIQLNSLKACSSLILNIRFYWFAFEEEKHILVFNVLVGHTEAASASSLWCLDMSNPFHTTRGGCQQV